MNSIGLLSNYAFLSYDLGILKMIYIFGNESYNIEAMQSILYSCFKFSDMKLLCCIALQFYYHSVIVQFNIMAHVCTKQLSIEESKVMNNSRFILLYKMRENADFRAIRKYTQYSSFYWCAHNMHRCVSICT